MKLQPPSRRMAALFAAALLSVPFAFGQKVESAEVVQAEAGACSAVWPGSELLLKLAEKVSADTPVALFVDDADTKLTATVRKDSVEARFQLPAKPTGELAPLFADQRDRRVSMGPTGGAAWEGGTTLAFGPPGVAGFSVDRWTTPKTACTSKGHSEEQWPRLGDTVTLWIAQPALESFKPADPILMWIDGQPVPGLVGSRGEKQNGLIALNFFWDQSLPSKAESQAAWNRILRRPWDKWKISISAGTAAGPQLPSWVEDVSIRRFSKDAAWWLLGVFVLIVCLLIYACQNGLLREPGKSTAPYSLARTQMVAWTLLVALALAGIWLVTWNEDVIPVEVLALMGITFGTALTAATVDDSKKAAVTSKGFLIDLISDHEGPAVSRVQMLIFTVILMIIFVAETIHTLGMPRFSPTLLGLMGVSSATYVSFKIPEKKG